MFSKSKPPGGIFFSKTFYVAPQQLCDILHKRFQNGTQLKEKTMFDFTKQTKQFEELSKRIQEVNEFWFNAIKEFFNTHIS